MWRGRLNLEPLEAANKPRHPGPGQETKFHQAATREDAVRAGSRVRPRRGLDWSCPVRMTSLVLIELLLGLSGHGFRVWLGFSFNPRRPWGPWPRGEKDWLPPRSQLRALRLRGNLQHPFDRDPGAPDNFVAQLHARSQVGYAVVEFLQRVHLHEPALVATAMVGRRRDELFAGTFLLQPMQHPGFG